MNETMTRAADPLASLRSKQALRIFRGMPVVALVGLLGVSLALSGCSKRVADLSEAPPHPFPEWVATLETGSANLDSVRERFGLPDEIEAGVRGETIWRYAYPEVRWPAGEPRKSSSGGAERVRARGALSLAEIGRKLSAIGDRFAALVNYPPAQPRVSKGRRLPARIHDLELVFSQAGLLQSLRYAPREGLTRVPDHG